MNEALLARAHVRHARLRPARHAFAYDTLFVMLPMRSWDTESSGLARNRRALLSFHDADHGDGGPDALAWLDGLLAASGIDDAGGEAWLLCFPRVLGFAFKPVSFWYCHRADGTLRAIVAEVNNTFGERHSYVLDAPAFGRELIAEKRMHVSPFCEVKGRYRFRFMNVPDRSRLLVRIDHDDESGPLLETSMACALEPATPPATRRALARFALSGAATLVRIHYQALLLWLRRVPFMRKPQGPDQPTTPQLRA